MNEMIQRVARTWQEPRRVTPTEYQVQNLRLPVSDVRFDRAMAMAARDMGGTYVPSTGTIKLPKEFARLGDHSFPTELQVLYRKFPCGMMIPHVQPDNPVAGLPCVSFDIIPNTPGDPRRSRIYQSFTGEAATSKTLFGKFLGWLKIISKAVNRYVKDPQNGRSQPFARIATEELMAHKIAQAWLLQLVR